MRTHEDSDVLQVCHCLLCRFILPVIPTVEDVLTYCDCRFQCDPVNSFHPRHSCYLRSRQIPYKQLQQNRKKPQIASNACRKKRKDRRSRNPDCKCWDFLAVKFCKAKRKLDDCRVELEGCGNGQVQWCSFVIFGRVVVGVVSLFFCFDHVGGSVIDDRS